MSHKTVPPHEHPDLIELPFYLAPRHPNPRYFTSTTVQTRGRGIGNGLLISELFGDDQQQSAQTRKTSPSENFLEV